MASSNLPGMHLEAGLQAHNLGDIEAAAAAYRRALAFAPEHADALHLLGVALMQLGDAKTAVGFLERAAHQQPNNAAIAGNLAQAYFACVHFEPAREMFRRASRLDPRNVHFQLGVANSLALQGKYIEAETLLRKITVRFPNAALAWFNLGNVQRDQGRAAESLESYGAAVAIDTQLVEARNNRADVLHKLLRFEDAEREYRACIQLAPEYLLARCNLASVVMDLGRFGEAEVMCRELIRRAPDLAQSHTLLGAALSHQGRLLEALACHRVAANLAPADAKAAQNLASALTDSGHLREGLRWFARALGLNPELTSTHQLLGYAMLGEGCLVEGWVEYSYRPWPDQFRQQYPQIKLARTLPAEVHDQHICVMREQGLGDELFFLRFVPQLAAAGARITYGASDKIGSLLNRVPSIAQVLEEKLPPRAGADAVILAGDLPHAVSDFPASPLPSTMAAAGPVRGRQFLRRIAVFWPRVPPPLALSPIPARITEMRKRLAAVGPPPYLGLTWRGGTPPREQRMVIWALYKEIGLAPLAAALQEIPGTFIALQRKPAPEEITALSKALARKIHDFTDLNDDLEGMLALLAVLDDYIGVSNTNMHLRASVGKTGRVLVPCPAEWRWMSAGTSSPWFPGFKVYRQAPSGQWDRALRALTQDLVRAIL